MELRIPDDVGNQRIDYHAIVTFKTQMLLNPADKYLIDRRLNPPDRLAVLIISVLVVKKFYLDPYSANGCKISNKFSRSQNL